MKLEELEIIVQEDPSVFEDEGTADSTWACRQVQACLGWLDRGSLPIDGPLAFFPLGFAGRYLQVRRRCAQREHIGFSRGHFNLDDAQLLQLLRNRNRSGAGV